MAAKDVLIRSFLDFNEEKKLKDTNELTLSPRFPNSGQNSPFISKRFHPSSILAFEGRVQQHNTQAVILQPVEPRPTRSKPTEREESPGWIARRGLFSAEFDFSDKLSPFEGEFQPERQFEIEKDYMDNKSTYSHSPRSFSVEKRDNEMTPRLKIEETQASTQDPDQFS